jgi:hypothetical protein
MIYESFPKRNKLHETTEHLADTLAGQLFSEAETAVQFKAVVGQVPQFLFARGLLRESKRQMQQKAGAPAGEPAK